MRNVDDASTDGFLTPLTTKKAIVFLVIIGIFVYGNMLFNGFVSDDFPYILNNQAIISGNSIFDLFGKNIFNSYGFYRPIPAFYFGILYHLFSTSAFFYHISSLALHITNTIVVYLFFRKFIKNSIAFCGSLLFLVHPINVESVSYISSAGNLLFTLFGITALHITLQKEIHTKRKFLLFGLLLASMLSKEAGVLFVVLAVLVRFLFVRKNSLIFLLFSFCTVLIYFLLRFSTIGMQENNYFFVPIQQLSLTQRLINIPEIIYFYITTLVFPANLAISQNWVVKTIDFNHFYFPLLLDLFVFCAIALTGYFVLKRDRRVFFLYSFFVVWFLIGLGIVLQIIPLEMTVAERWMYFPMIGLIGAIGIVANSFPMQNFYGKKIVPALCILIVILFSFRTMVRNTNWYDNVTLTTHDIYVSDDYSKEANLGEELINKGLYTQALVHTQKAVVMNPFYGTIGLVGTNYIYVGDTEKAEAYFRKLSSIPRDTYSVQSVYESSSWFLIFHYPEKAKAFILRGLQQFPNSYVLWANLALLEYMNHDRKNALAAIEKARSIQSTPLIDQVYESIVANKAIQLPANMKPQ